MEGLADFVHGVDLGSKDGDFVAIKGGDGFLQ
jgi:hypothetical protein